MPNTQDGLMRGGLRGIRPDVLQRHEGRHKGITGHAGGHLPGRVPAHAVAHYKYTVLGLVPERVFIVGSYPSRVGVRYRLDAHGGILPGRRAPCSIDAHRPQDAGSECTNQQSSAPSPLFGIKRPSRVALSEPGKRHFHR